MESLTIDEAVRQHAATRPDDIAVVDPHGKLTWAELNRAADQVTEHLRAAGIGEGGRVAWYGPNTRYYPAALLGIWRLGAASVGLNFRLPVGELAAAGQNVDLGHVIADFRFAEPAEAILPGHVTVTGPDSAPWDDLAPTPSEVRQHDPASYSMIYFTSGSTGTAKAVPLSHRAVESTVVHAWVHHFKPESRSLIVPPAFHVAGATWTNYNLKGGSTIVYSDDPSPAGLAKSLADGITHSIMVPTLIAMIVDELKKNPREFPALEHIGYGASPITDTLLSDALEILKCDFSQVYGMTEAGGGVTFLLDEDHTAPPEFRHRLKSAGRPGQDVELEIRGPDGTVLPRGESGELWFRTPCLTDGYLGIPDPTGGVLIGGWLNTRDMGYQDEDGYVYIQGRSDDMIVTGGENVHPLAVENVLASHPSVADVAVYGIKHPIWGQQVCAAIVRGAADLTEAELVAYCSDKLANFQIPKTWIFIDELPRTATGKVVRANLVDQTEVD